MKLSLTCTASHGSQETRFKLELSRGIYCQHCAQTIQSSNTQQESLQRDLCVELGRCFQDDNGLDEDDSESKEVFQEYCHELMQSLVDNSNHLSGMELVRDCETGIAFAQYSMSIRMYSWEFCLYFVQQQGDRQLGRSIHEGRVYGLQIEFMVATLLDSGPQRHNHGLQQPLCVVTGEYCVVGATDQLCPLKPACNLTTITGIPCAVLEQGEKTRSLIPANHTSKFQTLLASLVMSQCQYTLDLGWTLQLGILQLTENHSPVVVQNSTVELVLQNEIQHHPMLGDCSLQTEDVHSLTLLLRYIPCLVPQIAVFLLSHCHSSDSVAKLYSNGPNITSKHALHGVTMCIRSLACISNICAHVYSINLFTGEYGVGVLPSQSTDIAWLQTTLLGQNNVSCQTLQIAWCDQPEQQYECIQHVQILGQFESLRERVAIYLMHVYSSYLHAIKRNLHNCSYGEHYLSLFMHACMELGDSVCLAAQGRSTQFVEYAELITTGVELQHSEATLSSRTQSVKYKTQVGETTKHLSDGCASTLVLFNCLSSLQGLFIASSIFSGQYALQQRLLRVQLCGSPAQASTYTGSQVPGVFDKTGRKLWQIGSKISLMKQVLRSIADYETLKELLCVAVCVCAEWTASVELSHENIHVSTCRSTLINQVAQQTGTDVTIQYTEATLQYYRTCIVQYRGQFETQFYVTTVRAVSEVLEVTSKIQTHTTLVLTDPQIQHCIVHILLRILGHSGQIHVDNKGQKIPLSEAYHSIKKQDQFKEVTVSTIASTPMPLLLTQTTLTNYAMISHSTQRCLHQLQVFIKSNDFNIFPNSKEFALKHVLMSAIQGYIDQLHATDTETMLSSITKLIDCTDTRQVLLTLSRVQAYVSALPQLPFRVYLAQLFIPYFQLKDESQLTTVSTIEKPYFPCVEVEGKSIFKGDHSKFGLKQRAVVIRTVLKQQFSQLEVASCPIMQYMRQQLLELCYNDSVECLDYAASHYDSKATTPTTFYFPEGQQYSTLSNMQDGSLFLLALVKAIRPQYSDALLLQTHLYLQCECIAYQPQLHRQLLTETSLSKDKVTPQNAVKTCFYYRVLPKIQTAVQSLSVQYLAYLTNAQFHTVKSVNTDEFEKIHGILTDKLCQRQRDALQEVPNDVDKLNVFRQHWDFLQFNRNVDAMVILMDQAVTAIHNVLKAYAANNWITVLHLCLKDSFLENAEHIVLFARFLRFLRAKITSEVASVLLLLCLKENTSIDHKYIVLCLLLSSRQYDPVVLSLLLKDAVITASSSISSIQTQLMYYSAQLQLCTFSIEQSISTLLPVFEHQYPAYDPTQTAQQAKECVGSLSSLKHLDSFLHPSQPNGETPLKRLTLQKPELLYPGNKVQYLNVPYNGSLTTNGLRSYPPNADQKGKIATGVYPLHKELHLDPALPENNTETPHIMTTCLLQRMRVAQLAVLVQSHAAAALAEPTGAVQHMISSALQALGFALVQESSYEHLPQEQRVVRTVSSHSVTIKLMQQLASCVLAVTSDLPQQPLPARNSQDQEFLGFLSSGINGLAMDSLKTGQGVCISNEQLAPYVLAVQADMIYCCTAFLQCNIEMITVKDVARLLQKECIFNSVHYRTQYNRYKSYLLEYLSLVLFSSSINDTSLVSQLLPLVLHNTSLHMGTFHLKVSPLQTGAVLRGLSKVVSPSCPLQSVMVDITSINHVLSALHEVCVLSERISQPEKSAIILKCSITLSFLLHHTLSELHHRRTATVQAADMLSCIKMYIHTLFLFLVTPYLTTGESLTLDPCPEYKALFQDGCSPALLSMTEFPHEDNNSFLYDAPIPNELEFEPIMVKKRGKMVLATPSLHCLTLYDAIVQTLWYQSIMLRTVAKRSTLDGHQIYLTESIHSVLDGVKRKEKVPMHELSENMQDNMSANFHDDDDDSDTRKSSSNNSEFSNSTLAMHVLLSRALGISAMLGRQLTTTKVYETGGSTVSKYSCTANCTSGCICAGPTTLSLTTMHKIILQVYVNIASLLRFK